MGEHNPKMIVGNARHHQISGTKGQVAVKRNRCKIMLKEGYGNHHQVISKVKVVQEVMVAGGGGGTFGGSEKSSITRLFSKNSLSDQIIWLLPLAMFGFIAAAIKEKLKIHLIIKESYH